MLIKLESKYLWYLRYPPQILDDIAI
jgi:hypothetical protein